MASVEDDESSYEEVEVTDDEEDEEESEGKVAYYMWLSWVCTFLDL